MSDLAVLTKRKARKSREPQRESLLRFQLRYLNGEQNCCKSQLGSNFTNRRFQNPGIARGGGGYFERHTFHLNKNDVIICWGYRGDDDCKGRLTALTMQDRWGNALPCDLANDDHDGDDDNDAGSDADDDVDGDDDDDDDSGGGSDDNGGQIFLPTPLRASPIEYSAALPA